MPINIKSKFVFLKNRKSKSNSKFFTRRIKHKHKKYTLKKKRKNFRKFGIGYIGGMQKSDDNCPICFAPYPERQLTCGHRFHSRCMLKWVTTKPPGTCPMCIAPLAAPAEQDLIDAGIIAQAEQAAQAVQAAQLAQVRRTQQAHDSAPTEDHVAAAAFTDRRRQFARRPSRLGQPSTNVDA